MKSKFLDGVNTIKRFYVSEDIDNLHGIKGWFYKNRFAITVFLIVFIVNICFSLFMRYPIITDETITMAEGFYLWGGKDWSSAFSSLNSSYYGYGYSVLYGFLSLLTDNIQFIYIFALCLNALLISFIPVIAFKLAANYFGIKKWLAMLIALVAGLYPAYFVLSKYAWNETMLLFLPWLIAYILTYYYQHVNDMGAGKKILVAVLLSALAVYAYSVHGRGLALVATTFIAIVLISLFSSNKITGIIAVVAALVVAYFLYTVDGQVKSIIVNGFLRTDASSASNTLDSFISKNFDTIMNPQYLIDILKGAAGQLYYIVCATFGVGIVALIVYFNIVKNTIPLKKASIPNKNLFVFSTFHMAAAFMTFAISVLFFSSIYITRGSLRSEYFIYGRYNESICCQLIFIVLCFFAMKQKKNKHFFKITIIVYAAFVVLLTLLLVRRIPNIENNSLSYSMVPSLMPFGGITMWSNAQAGNFIILSIVVSGLFLVCLLCLKKKKIGVLALLLMGIFIYSAQFSWVNFLHPSTDSKYNQVAGLLEFNKTVDDLADTYPNVYVADATTPKPSLQFALPNFNLTYFDETAYRYEELADIEENSLIISTSEKNYDEIFEEIYEVVTPDSSLKYWVYGDALKNELLARGYACTQNNAPELTLYRGVDLYIPTIDPTLDPSSQVSSVKQGSSIYLFPDGYQFGPYQKMLPGKYSIKLYGENLDLASYRILKSIGSFSYPIEDFEYKTSDEIQFTVELQGIIPNFEIFTRNVSGENIRIDGILVELVEPQRMSIKDARELVDSQQNFGVAEERSYYRTANVQLSGNAIQGQTKIDLNPNTGVSVAGIKLNPGVYYIVVPGINMQNAMVSFDAEHDIASQEYIINENKQVIKIVCEDYIDNGELTVTNDSAGSVEFAGFSVNLSVLSDESMEAPVEWQFSV